MDDEWVVGWTAFDAIDFSCCCGIERMSSEAVYRLGGECHGITSAEVG